MITLLLSLISIAVTAITILYMYYRDILKGLSDRITHLEDAPEAARLIAEYRKLGGIFDTVYRDGRIRRSTLFGYRYYSLEKFDCEVLCNLRKQKLDELQRGQGRKKK